MLIIHRQDFDNALEAILGQPYIGFDVETDGLLVWKGNLICGVGICLPDFTSYYFPFRHKHPPLRGEEDYCGSLLDLAGKEELNLPLEWMQELWEAMRSVECIVGHNIKFDLAAAHQDGFYLSDGQRINDTIAGGRLVLQERFARISLENLTNVLIGPSKWKKTLGEYFKERRMEKRYDWVEVPVMAEYCCGDVENTLKIWEKMKAFVTRTEQTRVWDQEQELLYWALWPMEREGLYFDEVYCNDRIPKMRARLDELANQIYEHTGGGEFDIGSMDQLNERLNSIGIFSTSYTKKEAKAQWDSANLLGIDHPVGSALLEWRQLEKQRSVYFEPLLTWPTPYLHPNFKSWGTVTGRLSCEQPNLQNLARGILNIGGDTADETVSEEALKAVKAQLSINKAGSSSNTDAKAGTGTLTSFLSYGKSYDDLDEETALSTRRLYIAPPGYNFYAMDFSQMEMRIFADYVQDPQMTQMIEGEGFDFHDHVAAEVWKVDKSSAMWKFYRTLAKCINFGLLYGIGSEKLAGQMQVTVEEAKKYKKEYFRRFPKAEQFIWKVKDTVHQRGYVVNRFGRRYYLTPEKDYVGVNYLVQGSSADLVKNRMVAIAKFLKDKKTRMVAQVHDELIFYVHHEEESYMVKQLRDMLEERLIKTRMIVDVSRGYPSWSQKAEVCVDCLEKKKGCICQQEEKTAAVALQG